MAVSGLEKSFGARHALAGVSFELPDGLTGLLGPNGAGKTTLMRCLAGITWWDKGEVILDGVDSERHAAEARRKVGFMPERVSFPNEMRVDSYVDFVGAAKGLRGSRRAEATEVALERAGLTKVRSRIIGNLSKGYRQRMGLAQALCGDPPIVILDEPTAGLDPLNLLEIRSVLAEYARDHAVLLSTHTLADARLLAERLLVLGAGSLVYEGPTGGMSLPGEAARQIRLRVGGLDRVAEIRATGSRVPDIRVAGSSDPESNDAAGGAVAAIIREAGATVVRTLVGGGTCDAVIEVGSDEGLAAVVQGLVLGGYAVLAVEPASDMLEDAFRQALGRSGPEEGR